MRWLSPHHFRTRPIDGQTSTIAIRRFRFREAFSSIRTFPAKPIPNDLAAEIQTNVPPCLRRPAKCLNDRDELPVAHIADNTYYTTLHLLHIKPDCISSDTSNGLAHGSHRLRGHTPNLNGRSHESNCRGVAEHGSQYGGGVGALRRVDGRLPLCSWVRVG
jgi:hypothetical protein